MIYRDENGQPIQVGKVKQVKVFDFFTGAIPAGLEVVATGGSSAVATNPAPRFSMTTAATSGSLAILRTAYDLGTTNLKAIWIEVDGISPSVATNCEIAFHLSGTNTGIRFLQDAANAESQIETVLASPTRQNSTYLLSGFVGDKRRIGFRWEPPRQKCWISQYESIEKELDVPDAASGAFRPGISIKATSDAAVTLALSSLTLTLEFD